MNTSYWGSLWTPNTEVEVGWEPESLEMTQVRISQMYKTFLYNLYYQHRRLDIPGTYKPRQFRLGYPNKLCDITETGLDHAYWDLPRVQWDETTDPSIPPSSSSSSTGYTADMQTPNHNYEPYRPQLEYLPHDILPMAYPVDEQPPIVGLPPPQSLLFEPSSSGFTDNDGILPLLTLGLTHLSTSNSEGSVQLSEGLLYNYESGTSGFIPSASDSDHAMYSGEINLTSFQPHVDLMPDTDWLPIPTSDRNDWSTYNDHELEPEVEAPIDFESTSHGYDPYCPNPDTQPALSWSLVEFEAQFELEPTRGEGEEPNYLAPSFSPISTAGRWYPDDDSQGIVDRIG
ncbi:hypothetical protein BDN72DRAFT_963617 [Pluteus cervinus]|uniref:Uncharacterized protein n=1 Tax=Pluteus cervinus TaxID=181527 RepID=A0ACD3AE37_9AGAR|nr:hypothetical protein BDN72DRAFT_963617 [Pluteus cervinus]